MGAQFSYFEDDFEPSPGLFQLTHHTVGHVGDACSLEARNLKKIIRWM